MNCRKSCNNDYHLTSNLLPHYLALLMLFNANRANLTQIRLRYLQYLSTGYAKFCFLCLWRLIYYVRPLQHVLKLSALSTHTCFELCTSLARITQSMRVCCRTKCSAGAVTNIPMMLSAVSNLAALFI